MSGCYVRIIRLGLLLRYPLRLTVLRPVTYFTCPSSRCCLGTWPISVEAEAQCALKHVSFGYVRGAACSQRHIRGKQASEC